MKPKTRLQHEVIANSQQLYKIENDMLSWAKKEVLEHKGFATKTRVICMDCGNSFSPELISRKRAVCPHCNTKLKIEQTKKRTDTQSVDLAYAEIYGEFQVIRNFEIYAYYREKEPARYHIREILQHWVLPDGKREIVGRYHNMGSCGWCGDMEIRKLTGGSYYSSYKMEMYPYKYHPDSTFKPMYRKYGITRDLEGMTFLEAINTIPSNPKAETLIKAKQYSLLGYCNDSNKVYHFWPSIKICLRNKYKVRDASIWFDYLDLLEYFKKDLNNAHYVSEKETVRKQQGNAEETKSNTVNTDTKEILSIESIQKEPHGSSLSHTDYEKFKDWLSRKAPYCSNPKNFPSQITEDEFLKLKSNYTGQQIANIIEQIENRKDLRKRYTNLYRTVLNWLKKEDEKSKQETIQQRTLPAYLKCQQIR